MTKSSRTFDPPLNDAEVARVDAFTTWLVEELDMRGWRMVVSATPCAKGSYASVKVSDNYQVATLELSSAWINLPADEKVHTLVHEGMHVTHYELSRLWNEEMWKHMGSFSRQFLADQWSRAIEMWTDHMTQVFLRINARELRKWHATWETPRPNP